MKSIGVKCSSGGLAKKRKTQNLQENKRHDKATQMTDT